MLSFFLVAQEAPPLCWPEFIEARDRADGRSERWTGDEIVKASSPGPQRPPPPPSPLPRPR